ncbi:MAG: PAS domain S-box protein [Chloroflexota bacterium]|nr:PAS domain S-box protein [Chloroflexota bacterium]
MMSVPTTILVVEDEAGARSTLCGILEEVDYRVIGLEKGADALKIMKKSPFDVVVVDIKLPDISGLEILEMAKEINPEAAVIITTGSASVETAVDAVNQGAYAYFTKPVNPDEIKNTIANALKQQRLSLENKKLVERLQRSSKLLFETNEKLQDDIAQRKRVEEALRLSAHQWQTTFDGIGDAVCLLDDDAKIIRCNKAMTNLIGRSYSEINGRNCCELLHGRTEPVQRCPFVRMKKSHRRETQVISLDDKWLEIAVDPLADDQGNIMGAVHIMADITERRRWEEILRQSEEFSSTLLKNAPYPMLVLNADTSIKYVNPALEEMSGFSLSEVIGMKAPYPWWTEETLGKTDRDFREARSKGIVGREELFKKKNGERFWVNINATPLIIDGEYKYYIANWVDVTERKRIEEQLKESRDYLEKQNDAIPDVIFNVKLPERTIQYINRSIESALGYKPEECIGQSVEFLYPSREIYEDVGRRIQKGLEQGKSVVISEHSMRRKDGSLFLFEARITFLWEADKVVAAISVVRDITERRRMEQELKEKSRLLEIKNKELQAQSQALRMQEQVLVEKTRELEVASKAKSEFLAHMSHELRTPLNVVIGFSELMLDGAVGSLNEEHKQCLNDILSSGQQLLSLINDILDLSKIEAGKMELKIRNITLKNILESLKNEIMPIISRRKQNLEVVIEDELPPVRADRDKVRQVLINLLSNSTKFTPDGGHLRVEVFKDNGWCRVSVIDDGIGIKKKDQKIIFEPFSQLDGSLLRESGGTGLGLAIAKQIIEKHGGRIWVNSKYGKGSQFHFTLPLVMPSTVCPV